MWITDQECRRSVQKKKGGGGGGGGVEVGLTPFSLVALLQTLAGKYVGTHTPESLAVLSRALHVLYFTSLEK